MLKHKASELPESHHVMLNALKAFFGFVEKFSEHLKAKHSLKLKPNSYNKGGYNVELNKHTFVSQYDLPIEKSASYSFLSLAIYDRVFNEKGLAVNEYGLPEQFSIDKHLLKYMRYELYINEKGESVWSESDYTESELSSEVLASKWLDFLIEIANKKAD